MSSKPIACTICEAFPAELLAHLGNGWRGYKCHACGWIWTAAPAPSRTPSDHDDNDE